MIREKYSPMIEQLRRFGQLAALANRRLGGLEASDSGRVKGLRGSPRASFWASQHFSSASALFPGKTRTWRHLLKFYEDKASSCAIA
jgi:hypothetical protein